MTDIRSFKSYFCNVILILDSFLLAFRTVISFSYFECDLLLKLITIFVYGTVIIIVFIYRYTIKEVIKIFILFFLCFFIYLKSKSLIPFYSILFIVASKDKKIDKIILANIVGICIALFIVFSMYFLGVIKTSKLDGGDSLGFINPNILSFYSTLLTLLVVYLRFEKIKYLDLFNILMMTFITFIISKSKTGLIIEGALFVLISFIKFSEKIKIFFDNNSYLCNIFFFLICVLGVGLTNIVPFFTKLNEYLTGRFGFAQIYVLVYGLHLFGADITDIDAFDYGHLVLDNGYARILINYGIIYFSLLLISFIILSKKKDIDTKIKILIFVFFLGLITETFWIPITTNITLVILSILLYNNSNHKKKIKFAKYIVGK